MQSIFAWDCSKIINPSPDFEEIIKNLDQIDLEITKNAPKWPLDKINKVDLAILRCAFWELEFYKKTPPKVIIDEAVELAKEFGNENSFSFINGCLGNSLKKHESTQP